MISFFLLMAALHATPTPSVSPEYAHAQQLVTIQNARHMNLYCSGTGSPTVVLDAGGTDTAGTADWLHVQPAVAKFARVCSYDRAGYGFSDPGPLPRTSNAVVDDLHAMLTSANIAPPYLLVAHGIAGLYASLYADRYASDVVAMVFVDPFVPGQEELFSSEFPKYSASEEQQLDKLRECAENSDNKQCRASVSELESRGEDGVEIDSAGRGYGDLPLIVFTSTFDVKETKTKMGASDPQVAAVQAGLATMHDQLAAQSSRGINCVIKTKDVLTDKPEFIVDAIRQAITLVAKTAKPSCPVMASPTNRRATAPRR